MDSQEHAKTPRLDRDNRLGRFQDPQAVTDTENLASRMVEYWAMSIKKGDQINPGDLYQLIEDEDEYPDMDLDWIQTCLCIISHMLWSGTAEPSNNESSSYNEF